MTQPKIIDGQYYCPIDNSELAGDGENNLECLECDYHIHESNLKGGNV